MSTWVTEGLVTNPLAGTLLADSGPTFMGDYEIHIIGSASILTACSLQIRNDMNDTTVQEQLFNVLANQALLDAELTLSTMGEGQRFRIITTQTVIGSIQVSMMIT